MPQNTRDTSNEYAMTVKPERVFEELQGYVKQGKSLGTVVFWALLILRR
jgi:hypothetical protein